MFDSTVARVETGVNGRMRASDAPGLGVEPRLEVLGDPVFEVWV